MVNFSTNMELLTLHGSQISLATRDKVTTPPIFYPPVLIHNRPGSASLSSTAHKNRFVSRNHCNSGHKKRPLSADSRFINNNLKESHRVKFDLDKKTSRSSNNLLKLLLDEPVSKYWSHKSNRRMSIKNNQQQELMNDDSTSCGESIEEDVQTVKSLSKQESDNKQEMKIENIQSSHWENNGETKSNDKDSQHSASSDDKAIISPFKMGTIKRPDSLKLTLDFGSNVTSKENGNSTNRSKMGSDSGFERSSVSNEKESNLSFGSKTSNVSFSTSNHKNPGSKSKSDDKNNNSTKPESSKNSNYDLWINENPSKSKSLDLPGRVSFSTSDVYEIDYSDYDDQESDPNVMIYDKFEAKQIQNTVTVDKSKDNKKKEYVKEHYMESNSDNEFDENYHGFKKVVSATTKEEEKSNPKGHYEVNQIIEDYKREIASLNQRHENELKMFERKNSSSSSSNLNNKNLKFDKFNEITFDDLQNDEIDIKKHFIDDDDDEFFQNEPSNNKASVIKNYYEQEDDDVDQKKIVPIKHPQKNDVKFNNIKNKNMAWDKEGKLLKIDSSNPVIKNYLKTKEADSEKLNNRVTITTANKRLNDLSKKPKNTRDSNSGKLKTSVNSQKNLPTRNNQSADKSKKLKSPSPCLREDSNLDEFQIEKVVSWMSVHEENFSEFEFSLKNDAMQTSGSSNMVSNKDSVSTMEQSLNLGQDTTYQDIVSIIKEIDQDKKDSSDFKSLKTDVEFKLNTILNSIESDDSQSPSEEIAQENSHDKLKEIFSYLDKVDSNCDKVLINSKSIGPAESEHQELEFALEPDVIEDVPKIADLLVLPNHQLARRIVKLSLRANEFSNAIQLSKEHVANVRNDKMKSVRLEKINCQNRLKEQKKHYEEIVARHQTFIEQLIKDKAALCEKVTQITRRIDSQNQAWEHRLKTEVERAKETAAAGEKIRREKWVRDNTKKIKELTVKGLELEINRMTANHKQEIEELKRQHQLDVIKAVDETKLRFEKIEQKIRESYADERETAIERERKAIKERYEKQMEDERKSFEQQRIRMIHDFESEKDRIYGEMREKEHQFEMKKEELINEKLEMLEDTKNTFKEKLKLREQKYESEMQKMQSQYESDFKIWKREHETTMKLRETERENTIREQYRMERDRQIEAIIAKIDAETIKNQQDFDIKFNRMKEKYELEIRELENSEKNIKEKYIDTRARLAEVEANNQNLQATNKSMELQLNHLNKLCEEYNREKDHLKDEARSEIKNELKSMTREHENEIQRIYSRVQQAIQKKDATLEAVQKENVMFKERCLKLDAIIRQQRKDYCTK